ncbi:class I SAM-dependent methyltransferase [Mycolicibacterium neoaurum]|uniref:class I SAM-dependent methyltransferase n=1 Tax=Mycolicibacterium neoaurum TaxID=1795 RepID=UPI00248B9228|nr:class I SAM-dependent methyltransferase [Mycolicibacterium neoaurum]WBP93052.1 class I SAM-dependent methyltransferase [Mycolicibacterium neoaurum]WBS06700.1 class I SAM-dependent methyltransferase [Mycolicibacterium neoaurum]
MTLTPQLPDGLGADLRSAGFTVDGVAALLGPEANGALGRGIWWPALRATGADRLSVLVRLFLLGAVESRDRLQQAFPSVPLEALIEAGVLEPAGPGGWRAALDIRPHSDGDRDHLVVSDQDAALRAGPLRRDHVLGIGGASMSLARAIIRTPVRRALDLGTGCGIQALHLDAHCADIVATDTNERALMLAAATARLNGMNWDMRLGSLFEPVAGERFDLIVSNPPFVIGSGATDYIYRDSGLAGDQLCRNLIEQLPDHLEPGGTAQIMANWIVGEQDWRERVAGWLAGTGLHAWVVQRELADPVSYVSLWLADAGEPPEVAAVRGGQWLDWFAEEGVRAIGMGLITVRRPAAGEQPEQILEEITGADEAPTGVEVQAFLARRAYLRYTDDDALLAARLSTAPVLLEQHSLPGPDGWQQIGAAVRRPGGPGAVIGVDDVFTALLAGCRGEVPLGTLIDLLAAHHGVAADALADAALPEIREAIGRGILYQAG